MGGSSSNQMEVKSETIEYRERLLALMRRVPIFVLFHRGMVG